MKQKYNYSIFLAINILAYVSNAFVLADSSTYTIFAPGISSSRKRVETYAKAGAFAGQNYSGIIFKDQKKPKQLFNKLLYAIAKKCGRTINREKIVFGRGHDIASVKKAVDKAASEHAKAQGILFGTCRGAAVIIQYLAQENSDWVKGVVLDSSFADVDLMIKAKISKFWSKLFFPAFYKQSGQQPLQVISKIKNKNIKILILYAKGAVDKHGHVGGDTTTPFEQHAKPLYESFKACGFDVTLMGYDAAHCEGIDSEHNAGDRKSYVGQLKAWYKKYGFLP